MACAHGASACGATGSTLFLVCFALTLRPWWQARAGALLRARRHMNDLLLDQVPLLRGLARALDELAAGCAPADTGAGALLLEQVHLLE